MASQKFYSLEQAAERLGIDQQAVKDMAAQGKLQQFRDRDQLMFKSEEVEALASSDATQLDQPSQSAGDTAMDQSAASGSDASGPIPLSENDATSGGSGISPADSSAGTAAGSSGFSDAIGISDADEQSAGQQEDNRDATGVSVFDADEVEHADPTAQTQVNQSAVGNEEAALDQVGSGSGLLDLTRESDDTSLGAAELLDEIYPGGGQEGDQQAADSGTSGESGSAIGSSGVMDATHGGQSGFSPMETGTSTQMAMEQPGDTATGGGPVAAAYYQAEPFDPGGSGFGAGMLLGAAVTLVLGLLIAVAELLGGRSPVLDLMMGGADAENPSQMLMIWAGGLFVGSLVLGLVGGMIGKAVGGK